ncbi:MAG: hypothetical protein QM761_08490 [Pseudoxanthomonas sp.]
MAIIAGKHMARIAASLTLCAGIGIIALAWAGDAAQPPHPRTPQALGTDQLFWKTLHSGDYAGIDQALIATTAAYLGDTRDPTTAAHLGFLHIWRISERARLQRMPPTIIDDMALSRRYFERAVQLDPTDARYRGFLASAMLAQANIDHDPELAARGAQEMRAAVEAWPAFNLFTSGYMLAGSPRDSEAFRQGLRQQWQNLEICSGGRIDPAKPDLSAFLETQEARRRSGTMGRDARACLNSEIAPHNMEGFFLNLGDMLVKSGEVDTAIAAYRAAQRTPGYPTWPYRDVLDKRIEEAQANVTRFNAEGDRSMMFNSSFSCMACHQSSP